MATEDPVVLRAHLAAAGYTTDVFPDGKIDDLLAILRGGYGVIIIGAHGTASGTGAISVISGTPWSSTKVAQLHQTVQAETGQATNAAFKKLDFGFGPYIAFTSRLVRLMGAKYGYQGALVWVGACKTSGNTYASGSPGSTGTVAVDNPDLADAFVSHGAGMVYAFRGLVPSTTAATIVDAFFEELREVDATPGGAHLFALSHPKTATAGEPGTLQGAHRLRGYPDDQRNVFQLQPVARSPVSTIPGEYIGTLIHTPPIQNDPYSGFDLELFATARPDAEGSFAVTGRLFEDGPPLQSHSITRGRLEGTTFHLELNLPGLGDVIVLGRATPTLDPDDFRLIRTFDGLGGHWYRVGVDTDFTGITIHTK